MGAVVFDRLQTESSTLENGFETKRVNKNNF